MTNITKAKILIVEDEVQINRLIELILQGAGYYNIQKAYDGASALEMIKKEKPDLVLLDVMIPNIDGFELCRLIKEDEYLKTTQVIMLTAKKMEEDILKGFESGAIDYISKPFSNKVLLARIKAHLENSNISSALNKYKNIELDDIKKTVKINNEIIELTNFEFKILKIFMSNTGAVFSRNRLLNYLWGDDGFNISQRAVDVQIVNLRKKLGDLGKNIKTIRGAGYKLEEE